MNVFIRHSSNKTLNGVYKHLTNTVYYNRSKRLYFRRYHNKYVITKTLNESLNFLAYYDISSCKFFVFVRGCYKFELQTEIEFDEVNVKAYPDHTVFKRVDLPMFEKDPAITQGQSGNCWLISTFISLQDSIEYCEKTRIVYLISKKNDTAIFTKLIEAIDDDSFKVSLFLNGKWEIVCVTNEFPSKHKSLTYVKAKCMWPLILEKAFFVKLGYQKINRSYPQYAFHILTSRDEKYEYFCKNSDNQWLCFNGKYEYDIDIKVLDLCYNQSYFTHKDIVSILNIKNSKKPIIVSINSSRNREVSCRICRQFSLNHTYIFLGIEQNKVILRDPARIAKIVLNLDKFLNKFNCISIF